MGENVLQVVKAIPYFPLDDVVDVVTNLKICSNPPVQNKAPEFQNLEMIASLSCNAVKAYTEYDVDKGKCSITYRQMTVVMWRQTKWQFIYELVYIIEFGQNWYFSY